ncbi:helix-turn-helix domain-containing protein [Nocardia wallacei]|uniref:helix-turn-helix domain-containing protein n=1 Tax=Nocardia wallacei TaxID=480035 RepID=UPI002453BA49|nr:helix-turn-helix domain-containing protein [Nocardia wallacei]
MTHLEYEVSELSTLAVTKAERAEYWAQHVRVNHGELDYLFSGARGFIGTTQIQRCGNHQLVEFWSDGICYRRTARHARADDDRSSRLLVPVDGQLVLQQSDHSVKLTPGSAALVCMARAFDFIHADGARAWVLTLPENALSPDRFEGGAPIFLDRRGPTAIALAMTRALAEERNALSATDFVAIASNLIELLGIAVRAPQKPSFGLQSIARAVRDYVADHSDDPQVTPAAIAHELGWSLRQIQLALRSVGTSPAELLRNQRLDRALSRLGDPGSSETISNIAYASGFSSLSAFGVAFRGRFGTTPRALRARSGPPDSADGLPQSDCGPRISKTR